MLISYIAIINWDNLTLENLESFKYIRNPQDRREVMEWLQQFFNEDISGSMYY